MTGISHSTRLGTLSAKIVDTAGRTAQVDNVTKSVQSIREFSHRINEGLAFRANHIFESVADGGSVNVLIQTGTVRKAAIKLAVGAGGDARIYLFEGEACQAMEQR